MALSRHGAFPAKTPLGVTDRSRIKSIGIGREGADRLSHKRQRAGAWPR